MIKIGVKYCGGCNPRFERGKLFHSIKSRLKEAHFEHAKEGVNYDALLVISGCTNNCASFQQYKYNKGVVNIKDSSELDRAVKELRELMEDEGVELERNI
jgi:hypothetical protein